MYHFCHVTRPAGPRPHRQKSFLLRRSGLGGLGTRGAQRQRVRRVHATHTRVRYIKSHDIHKAGPGRGYRGIMPRARTVNTVARRYLERSAKPIYALPTAARGAFLASRLAWHPRAARRPAPSARASAGPLSLARARGERVGSASLQVGCPQVRIAGRWLLGSNGGHSLFRGLTAPPSPPGLRGDVRTCDCAPASEM